jgi:hypothetical protein
MILTLCGTAGATTVASGDPDIGGSWSQGFNYGVDPPTYHYTQFQMKMVTLGDSFETPVAWSSAGPMQQVYNDGTIVIASGPRSGANMSFSLTFAGGYGNPLTFYIQTYDQNLLVANQVFDWNGYGWVNGNPANQVIGGVPTGGWEQQTPIPEPLTMLVVGSAVAGIGAYIRKRRLALA